MSRQIIFAITLLITLSAFGWTTFRLARLFMLTKPAFRVRNFWKRVEVTLEVAIGQSKILRKPVIGLFHALVFWGFCVILFGSIEMVIDGLSGSHHSLEGLGIVYKIILASGDIFALLVGVSIVIFLFRRLFMHIRRFSGIEMKHISHLDANFALTLILLLMITLQGMNVTNVGLHKAGGLDETGGYPVSAFLYALFPLPTGGNLNILHEIFWWSHIILVFIFANILPYSKHFHVFMSVPNVFLSRLDPLGKLPNMNSVTREVKLMLYPGQNPVPDQTNAVVERFGVKDIEDVSWKNYLDSLSCTECGRCTSVCPANITGKLLSPRKIIMNVRARMKEKGPSMLKNGKTFSDKKSLLRTYVTEEELWACTTCQACARECPVNINHPTLIVDMRRYLVMEEGSAPAGLKQTFSNIENNGAPWQFSPEDRLLWAKELTIKKN